MGYWELSSGDKPSGSEAASFASNFMSVPDNTQANAIIKSFEPKEFNGEKSYQVIWVLADGDFKGAMVKQSLQVFNQDHDKADRAKNMMMRLYQICGNSPKHNNAPGVEDLAPMLGKKCSIKIGNGVVGDKERTWVREVHEADKLEVSTGHTHVTTGYPEGLDSALSRNPRGKPMNLNDDIGF